ncbi:hypothetical protein OO012_10440 [Rhodobacteraceae bacterium KMM 6894]|nr:hypothetical protein [Rhodobacteraceae bacterium KMM 6894]
MDDIQTESGAVIRGASQRHMLVNHQRLLRFGLMLHCSNLCQDPVGSSQSCHMSAIKKIFFTMRCKVIGKGALAWPVSAKTGENCFVLVGVMQ